MGGVLVGRDLIQAAELRSLVKQIEEIDTATNTFRLKYNCLAGDCANASQFFSGIVNGNGNGVVNHRSDGTDAVRKEHWKYWQSLARAGLIAGQYTGTGGPGGGQAIYEKAVIGINVPATKIKGAGITIYNHLTRYSVWNDPFGLPRALNKHIFIIGSDAGTTLTQIGKIPLHSAKALDDKFDDGLANKGKIGVYESMVHLNNVGCTTGVSPNFSYGTDRNAVCSVLFFRDW